MSMAITTTIVLKTTANLELDSSNKWFDITRPNERIQVNYPVTQTQSLSISHFAIARAFKNREQALELSAMDLRNLIIQLANRR